MGASPVGWVLLRSGGRCYSGCASQAHRHFLSVSTQNSSVMDHAALCCTSSVPEMFSRSPALLQQEMCDCGVGPRGAAIALGHPAVPRSHSPRQLRLLRRLLAGLGVVLGPAELGAAVVRPGHVENAAPHLVSLTHSWPGSLGALVVLICCFCLIPELGGICVPVHLMFGAEGSAGPGSLMVQCSGRTGTCNLLSVRLFIS